MLQSRWDDARSHQYMQAPSLPRACRIFSSLRRMKRGPPLSFLEPGHMSGLLQMQLRHSQCLPIPVFPLCSPVWCRLASIDWNVFRHRPARHRNRPQGCHMNMSWWRPLCRLRLCRDRISLWRCRLPARRMPWTPHVHVTRLRKCRDGPHPLTLSRQSQGRAAGMTCQIHRPPQLSRNCRWWAGWSRNSWIFLRGMRSSLLRMTWKYGSAACSLWSCHVFRLLPCIWARVRFLRASVSAWWPCIRAQRHM